MAIKQKFESSQEDDSYDVQESENQSQLNYEELDLDQNSDQEEQEKEVDVNQGIYVQNLLQMQKTISNILIKQCEQIDLQNQLQQQSEVKADLKNSLEILQFCNLQNTANICKSVLQTFQESELNQSSLNELIFNLDQTLTKSLKFELKASEETKQNHILYPIQIFQAQSSFIQQTRWLFKTQMKQLNDYIASEVQVKKNLLETDQIFSHTTKEITEKNLIKDQQEKYLNNTFNVLKLKDSIISQLYNIQQTQDLSIQSNYLFQDTQQFLTNRNKNKIKKPKDYRLSKGRKIKYEKFEKLQDFISKQPNHLLLENRDMILQNLFQKQQNLQTEVQLEGIKLI